MSINPTHPHGGLLDINCTLCRSSQQSYQVLQKAKQRQIQWPKPLQNEKPLLEDPVVYTSIDDAFSTIMHSMTSTSKQCKRYYASEPGRCTDKYDRDHCGRFHTPHYTKAQRSNPLQRAEDVHLQIHPGVYAVTAGAWGGGGQQTHMVTVEAGQTVSMDFCL